MEKIQDIALGDLTRADDGDYIIVDDFVNDDGPLFGETLFYRIVYTRIAPYVTPSGDPKLAMGVSTPSRPVLSNLNDVTNRTAERPTVCSLSTQNSAQRQIRVSWPKAAHNCTYQLCHITSAGTWARLAEIKSNDPVMSFEPSLPYDRLTEDGDPRFYRFKVDVINASGLISLRDEITTINMDSLPDCL